MVLRRSGQSSAIINHKPAIRLQGNDELSDSRFGGRQADGQAKSDKRNISTKTLILWCAERNPPGTQSKQTLQRHPFSQMQIDDEISRLQQLLAEERRRREKAEKVAKKSQPLQLESYLEACHSLSLAIDVL